MQFCSSRGIPRSWFLGGPYRWTDHDREAALAYQRYEAELCVSCGTRREEWYDDEGRFARPAPYGVEMMRCPGCREVKLEWAALARQTKAAMGEGADEKLAGVYPALKRNPDWRPIPEKGGD